ncbi:hypothetical protein RQP46_008730 [Phenoliferia psychrophenolica]
MLAPVALMVLSTLSVASAQYSYGYNGGYAGNYGGAYNGYNGGYNGGGFIGGQGGYCGSSYAGIQYGGYYKRDGVEERGVSDANASPEKRDATDGDVEKRSDSDIMKRTFGNGGLCCAIFGCFCSSYTPAPVYVCVNNYPHPYPVQGGWPGAGWSGSGCGCDGYAVDYAGRGVPHDLPADFQFFGTKGWTAPANWKQPAGNFVPTAATAKALASAHWYNPAQSHALANANTTAAPAEAKAGSTRSMHRARRA